MSSSPAASPAPILRRPHLWAAGPWPEFPHRLDGLRPRFGHQYDWTSFIPERHAHLVGQVFFVLVGEQFVAVDEQQKRRRRLPYLRRVHEPQAMAQVADGLAALDGVPQRAV